MEFKTCSKCGRSLPATTEFFYRKSKSRDGLQSCCKACARAWYETHKKEVAVYDHAYRVAHTEQIAGYKRAYVARHKQEIAARSHTYDQVHKEQRVATQRAYYEAHKEQVLARTRAYRELHREEEALYYRAYHETHRDEQAAYRRVWHQRNREHLIEYKRQRLQANPMVRLTRTISSGIGKALRERKAGRHWEDLVGYTLDALAHHLESLFQPGMSWSNHGPYGWHIDHIQPIASFHFETPDDPDFKRCWALDNLQPMWWRDNLQKHTRRQR